MQLSPSAAFNAVARFALRAGTCKGCKAVKPRVEFGPPRVAGRARDHLCLECRSRAGDVRKVLEHNRGACRACECAMSAPDRKWGWRCADCIAAEKRNFKRAKAAARDAARGYAYSPKVKKRQPDSLAETTWRRVEEKNAIQAWRYWVEQKAPAWWLQAHEWAKYAEKPWNRPGITDAEKFRLRYRNDPEFRLSQLLRNYRRKAARGRYGEYLRVALKNATSSAKVAEVFGFTISDLRTHLERQFTKGMDWRRFNTGEIHIDHIRPLASFDLDDPDGLRAAWALTNLRPLWAKDNLAKGAKIEALI